MKKERYFEATEFKNIKEIIYNSAEKYGENTAFILKHKKDKEVEYENISYKRLLKEINYLGTKLFDLGYQNKRIAIVGRNRYEWVLTHLANLLGGMVSIPLDKELQVDELESCIKRSRADIVVFDEKYIDNIEKVDYHPVGEKVGRKIFVHNAQRDYIDYLKSIVNVDFKGLKVVLDCANGAAYKVAPTIFSELGANVVTINSEPDGNNINDKCGSTHPEKLQEAVVKHKANLGLAYDGDADRLIAVDENGNIVDGDHIMVLSAIHLKNKGKLAQDTLVVTVMSNIGLTIAAKEHGINLATTVVGDRYVLEEMKNSGYNLGGEQSGHMIFLDYNTTGDGVLSSLVLAQIVLEEGKNLSELAAVMTQYPQVLVNARIKNENKNRYMEYPEIKSEIERIEKLLDGCGRVLIRPSGTEPLVRVMLEGKEEGQIKELATNLANLIQEKLS